MAPHRFTTVVVAALALTTIHCSDNVSKARSSEKICSSGHALQSAGLRGTSMPPKSIALTFDDGPGPRTRQLSTFLKDEGIEAAFFVNGGQMRADGAGVLQQLVDDGHLVANHTETHRSLTGIATATPRLTDPEVVQEIADTDVKIDPFIPSKRFLFRPPFGDFDDLTLASLSSSPMNKYIGPVLWDVGDRMDEQAGQVADWDCWEDGTDMKRTPMTVCGDLYVTEIKRADHGIVLLHDPYVNALDPEQLGTVDMVRYMVPILKREGFTFMRVDKVPEIDALLPPDGTNRPDGGSHVAPPPGPNDKNQAPNGDENPCL